jgi:hypothetical protein
VNETTAQEASGATIAAWDDLKVDLFFTRRAMARSSRIDACMVERPAPCAGQEAVDAAGPVDAQNAPTGPWKTADGCPQAPTAIIVFLIKEKRQRSATASDRPATITEFRCGRQRRSFANPSPAEIVVVDRQN